MAYAFAIVSGDISCVPSAMEGAWSILRPSARATPIFLAMSMTGQMPMSLISCT